jgi:putative ABC transport system permease protein
MVFVALRMLFGDRTKYITLVMGLAFATLLINQQAAIFMGLLKQSTGPLQNVSEPDLWVGDPGTKWIAEFRSLADQKLGRVRSVEGVKWAEPFLTNWAVCELKDGDFQKVQIMGIPRSTLVGRPPAMTAGKIEDLRIPDAIVVEEGSREKLGNIQIGGELKINDKRAVVVGFCKAKKGFESNCIIYTTYDNALGFVPLGTKRMSYILVKVADDAKVSDVAKRIDALGDVVALTHSKMVERTIRFIIVATGIGLNFAITIALGFVVGALLSAAIFYQFTLENLRHFAVLKALGTTGPRLIGMVLTQAIVVAVVGYGIGVGVAGVFTLATRKAESELSVFFPWQLAVASFGCTLLCIGLGSIISLRRVVKVSPSIVFGS